MRKGQSDACAVAGDDASGTGLWVGFTWVEWNGYFPSEAFQTHREQSLSVS